MKLRNKKTGEIIETGRSFLRMPDSRKTEYGSLEELYEEWEDFHEEPKEYWFINNYDRIEKGKGPDNAFFVAKLKQIGNYFETKEEAEKAVEKLKAWKLLKDECKIKFDGIIRDKRARLKGVKINYDRHPVTFDRMRECMDALHLLFGDEK